MQLTCGRKYWLTLLGVLLVAAAGVAFWLVYTKPTPTAPIKQPLSAGSTTPGRIARSFPFDGIKKVIFRAAEAETCEVTTDPAAEMVEVSGLPEGDAKGYHSDDPNWRETPAAEWGLDFVSARHGDLLVISTQNEIQYIHHLYYLKSLALRVPAGIEVVREQRKLTGDGGPNLQASKP